MVVFAAVTLGAWQYVRAGGGTKIVAGWMIVLFAMGTVLRRTLWRDLRFAAKAVGIAIAFSLLVSASFPLTADSLIPWGTVFADALAMMVSLYLPFYWLPLAAGLLVGGLNRSKQQAEPISRP